MKENLEKLEKYVIIISKILAVILTMIVLGIPVIGTIALVIIICKLHDNVDEVESFEEDYPATFVAGSVLLVILQIYISVTFFPCGC